MESNNDTGLFCFLIDKPRDALFSTGTCFGSWRVWPVAHQCNRQWSDNYQGALKVSTRLWQARFTIAAATAPARSIAARHKKAIDFLKESFW